MIVILKKLNILLCMSALSAGIIFCLCGFALPLPKGVTVNGYNVGGMTTTAAVTHLRRITEEELKSRSLKIISNNGVYAFSYPEISYKDNFRAVLKSARRGGDYSASVSYYLCGLDEIATAICRNERIERIEPSAQFQAEGKPFIYDEGRDGREVNVAALKTDVLNSLKGGFEDVHLKYISSFRRTNMHTVRENTSLLSEFSTGFDSSNVNRSSNIRLAAALINGVVVQSGECFSFNHIVGARLPERGFYKAKIIENGEYTEGIGGGVCQVSTTLYNAALLAGLTVTEYHPHSLAVGYVAPSRDAMVSGSACDLKFKNTTQFPVYIRSEVSDGKITFRLYGKSDGAVYSIESVITGSVPAPFEKTDNPELVREGRDGIISEGYLVINRGGFIKRVKLRKDRYMPVKHVILASSSEEITEIPVKTD